MSPSSIGVTWSLDSCRIYNQNPKVSHSMGQSSSTECSEETTHIAVKLLPLRSSGNGGWGRYCILPVGVTAKYAVGFVYGPTGKTSEQPESKDVSHLPGPRSAAAVYPAGSPFFSASRE